ncbi:MAG: tetrahydrofolate dehydrogenase/cyclohydrolase catalytic domain-containing protein [Longimicrobiales bacterium]
MDGRALARRLRASLRDDVATFVDAHGIAPRLLAFGSAADTVADTYLTLKLDAARNAGVRLDPVLLPVGCDTAGAVERVMRAAGDDAVHGIFVQYPLPGIDARACFDVIPVSKDIDGASAESLRRLRAGAAAYPAASAAAIVALLEHGDVALADARVFIARGAAAIAEPLAILLARAGADVVRTSAGAGDVALRAALANAAVSIFPAGVPAAVQPEWLPDGAVVVDGGYFGRRRAGDDVLAAAAPRLAAYVPSRGGVGPVTVEMLLGNTLDAARAQVA